MISIDIFDTPSILFMAISALMLFGVVDGLALLLQWIRTRLNRRGK